ncbi:hypothetical protein KP729_000141|nr:hypothetical protein [Delftia acidovorans]
MAGSPTRGCTSPAPGRYTSFVHYGRLPFPDARRWTGALWADERGLKTADGPHDTATDSLDWDMEQCPAD